ncbi:MAG: hypothetical protein Q4G68_07525 [Planctomycetia bacterium]|nr:hypothetical protein [Planctomycetia bacterium]
MTYLTENPIFIVSLLLCALAWNVPQVSFTAITNQNKTVDEVLQMIREYKSHFGYPPTFNDYEVFMKCLSPDAIEDNTVSLIHNEILKQQHPKITVSEIEEIIKTKRSSVKNFRVRYNIVTQEEKNHLNKQQSSQCEFAFKDDMYYLDVNIRSLNSRDKISYDGHILRRLRQMGNLPNQGEIRQGDDLSVFYDPWMPLTLAGLFDTQSCGVPNYMNDLMLFLHGQPITLPDGTQIRTTPYVFEKMENVGGHDCISVSGGTDCKYLAIDCDYSLVQWEEYATEGTKLPNGQMVPERILRTRGTVQELIDYGNGIWLPQQITIHNFSKTGQVEQTISIKTVSASVNDEIDTALFRDILPDNTLVSDAINDVVYHYGERESIRSISSDIMKNKKILIYRSMGMAIGLTLVILAVFLKYRQNRKHAETDCA